MRQKWMDKLFRKDTLLYAVVILGILGMGCILFSSFDVPEKEDPQAEQAFADAGTEQYRLALQEQLTQMLGKISGVGTVQVLVTVNGSEQYHYATEGDSLVTNEQMKSSSTYVTIGGSSSEKPLVESVSRPAVTGVVVACTGGDRDTVQEAVYRAVSVACGISTAQIYVTRLDGNVQ